MAELAILMPSQNYSMLSETRATRSIYHVYSVYLVTAQYSEASHEWQEVPIHQGNVTTCHIGINAKPFHEPPPHTWVLNHYICLAVLMQVMSSGRLNLHAPLKCKYKELLMSPFLSYKMSCGVWEQPTALGSMLRRFIWLLIRTILLYLRDHNLEHYLQRNKARINIYYQGHQWMQKNRRNCKQMVCSMGYHFSHCPFTENVTWDWKRANKRAIHAKDSSLEKLMAAL